jgi:hypothetical protein
MRWSILIAFSLVACSSPATQVDGIDDSLALGKADNGGLAEGTPEACGILAVANGASEHTLNNDVGLDSRAADNIVAARVGDDGVAGTSDDVVFTTLAQLDAVPYVGPVAFKKLLAYAKAQGDVAACTSSTGALPAGMYTPGGSCDDDFHNSCAVGDPYADAWSLSGETWPRIFTFVADGAGRYDVTESDVSEDPNDPTLHFPTQYTVTFNSAGVASFDQKGTFITSENQRTFTVSGNQLTVTTLDLRDNSSHGLPVDLCNEYTYRRMACTYTTTW